MTDLADTLAQNGVQSLLSFTQTRVALIKPDGTLIEWNLAFNQMKEAFHTTKYLQDFFTNSSRAQFSDMLYSVLRRKQPAKEYLELLAEPGGCQNKCLLIPLSDGNLLFFAETDTNIQREEASRLTHELQKTKRALNLKQVELKSVLAQVDEIAHTDPLTYLSNRRQIVGDIQREVAFSDRYEKPLCIFMVDIDHFKKVNDTYGHASGDQVLRAIATQLRAGTRETDKVGRYGGEEFLILLPGTSLKSAVRLANRMLKLVRTMEISIAENIIFHITVSLGIAQYCPNQEAWDSLLDRADKALYHSKGNGRDQWSISSYEKDGTIKMRSARKKPEWQSDEIE